MKNEIRVHLIPLAKKKKSTCLKSYVSKPLEENTRRNMYKNRLTKGGFLHFKLGNKSERTYSGDELFER